jgi:small subunit ribosomal protein S17
MSQASTIKKRTLIGVVVSDSMQKTIVVQVDRLKKHPKYERRYRISKRYKAHDEKGEFHTGDRVVIEESRPYSRDKRWKGVKKIGTQRIEEKTDEGMVKTEVSGENPPDESTQEATEEQETASKEA